MIEFADTRPDVSVPEAEYRRLLGYPPGRTLDGPAAELAGQARAWYQAHGRPWVYARSAGAVEVEAKSVRIDGVPFAASRLRAALGRAGARQAVLVAVGAGAQLEAEASRHWREERPDEYFFLDVFGSCVVERLMTITGARLCEWAAGQGWAVLPHDSPGYPGWPVGEQLRLLEIVMNTRTQAWPGPIEALDSGALRPTKSQLAVFGLTRQDDRPDSRTTTVPCETCSYDPCRYRRAPQSRRCQHPT
jgi:hypothetical protein